MFSMNAILVLLSISVLFCSFSYVQTYEVNGFCGRPEKPLNSKLMPEKLRYSEGEEVSFQCSQYWNYFQTKRCVKGNWIGMQFRCGKSVVQNDVNYVKVEDISEEKSKILFDQNITQSPNYKFPNSYLSNRAKPKFQVESDRKSRWTLGIQTPVSLPFFKLNFHFMNVSVEESVKIDLSVNASVGPLRTCRHVFRNNKRMWRGGTKVEVNFECDANSEHEFIEDMKKGSDQIIIETQSSAPITYRLIAVFLAQAYGTSALPLCGEPEQRFGQMVRILWPKVNYTIDCMDSMRYVSVENYDLPETTIHAQKCIYDMRWNGSFPECVPKSMCPVTDIENQINPIYKVVRFDDVFYFNETTWVAIDGSTVHYQCNDSQNEVLLGDAVHVCRNGQWIGAEPNCFDLSEFKKKKPKNRATDENIDLIF